jgi:hypothetical protein
MASPKHSRQATNIQKIQDMIRNERQKTMLLLEERHLLNESSGRLIEQSQRLFTRTKKLIEESIQGIKRSKVF